MYTNANAIRDLAFLAGAWMVAIYSFFQMDSELTVTCNGHGCTGHW